jgi:hypothetical protein
MRLASRVASLAAAAVTRATMASSEDVCAGVLQVRVMVGEPVQVDDLLAHAREQGWEEDMLHRSIADRVGQRLVSMHDQLLGRQGTAAQPADPSSSRYTSGLGVSSCDVAWQQLSFNMWHREWCTAAAASSS